MKAYAIFGAGFLSGAVLVSGVFFINTKVGKVIYISPSANTASVLVGDGDSQILDAPLSETLDNGEDVASAEREEETSSVAAPVEVESGSVQTTSSSDYVAELQEQVESLIEQVSAQTTESAGGEENDNDSDSDGSSDGDEVFFVTPTGVKIDEYGNVIGESTSQSQSGGIAQEEEPQQTEPGVFITPTGVKIDAEGNIIE